ncbi:MAG: topoisomerase, partial [Hyphomicrobiales bacterium]|nr:topoisomerase [Hyphomicrobiales bacterium]
VLDSLNDLLGAHIFPDKGDGSSPRACPSCGAGQLSLKLGKFGAFIGCSNYPECKYTRTMDPASADQAAGDPSRPGVRVLGIDPTSGEEVTVRDGRFGTYVQLGEGEKPKRCSLPKGLSGGDVTLEQAIALLSLPREVAKHPETGEPILAGIGRFGSYVQHGKTYANLGREDDVLAIGGNRAVDLILTKEAGGGQGRFGASAGRPLGDHPKGGAISVKAGKYGPYVNWGKVNATLPKGTNPEEYTLEEALALIAAKEAGGGDGAGRLLGQHPAGGPVSVRAGRFGAYVNWGKVNATIGAAYSPETITLEEGLRLVEEKGGAAPKKSPAKKKAPAKKAAAKKAPAKSRAKVVVPESDDAPFADAVPAKKAAIKAAAVKKTPAKKAPAKKAAAKKAPARKAATAK